MIETVEMGKMELRYVDPDRLSPNPQQPRQGFDRESLKELADSLKARGELQPIVVREYKGAYQIIAGERRWRAAKLAKLAKVPILIREVPEEDILLDSMVENLQRQDLSDVEREGGIAELMKTGRWTHEQLAKELGYEHGDWVQNQVIVAKLREKEHLPASVPTSTVSATQTLEPIERKAVLKEAEQYRLTRAEVRDRVKDIKESREKGLEPVTERLAIVKGNWLVDRFKGPCEELLTINLSAFKELSDPQRREVTSMIRRVQTRLSQWMEKLEGNN